MTDVPLAPHELLNQQISAPAIDPEGTAKLHIATAIFVSALQSRLASPETISVQSIKTAAVIASDAASVLLAELAKR